MEALFLSKITLKSKNPNISVDFYFR